MRMINKDLSYYKLLKVIGNPKSKLFSDGFFDIDTEKMDYEKTRKLIVDFHKKYYSGNIMTLVITSDYDFDTVR